MPQQLLRSFANVPKQRVFKIYRDAVFDTLTITNSLTVSGDLLLNGPPIVGATGATGPQGGVGATGSVGASGPPGGPGFVGQPGAVGATGQAGLAGSTGATGSQGTAGPGGDAGVIGPTGATGVSQPGQQGPTGSGGPAGEQAGIFEFSSGTIFEDDGSGTPTPASIPVTLNSDFPVDRDVLFLGKGFSYIKRDVPYDPNDLNAIDITGLPIFAFVSPKNITVTRISATVHDLDGQVSIALIGAPSTPDPANRLFSIPLASVNTSIATGETVSATNASFNGPFADEQAMLVVTSIGGDLGPSEAIFTGVSVGLEYTSP